MKKAEIKHIREEIPIIGYDEEWECFECGDGSFINIYQINPKDLVNSDVDEIEMDCFKWAKFYKTYGLDVQIISMMFPCDTGAQQKYWKKRLENNKNPMFQSMIQVKINELEWREKHTATKEFFMSCFYPEKKDIADAVKVLENTLGIGNQWVIKENSRKKKEWILFKLANKGLMIFRDRSMEKKFDKKETIDEELLERISPAGGIRHYETYSRTGTGYESCIHVWDFPATLSDYWLTKICSQTNSIATISVHTEDQTEVKKNLNKSIEEQASRKRFAKEYKDFYDAERRETEMQTLYDELSSMDEVIKSVSIRIFTVGKTYAELEEANARVIHSLEADNYRAAIFLNETEQEWKSVYYGAERQTEAPHALPGLPLKATLLAAGNAFHFSNLEDLTGDFVGETACGGNVIFDEFARNDIRVSASAVIVGKQRFGKSTLLKKRLKARALRGDFTRTFDITGEFSALTRKLGGRVLNMDGTDGKINLLEIFRSGDTEHTSYTRHLSKLKTSYHFLKPNVEAEEINTLIETLESLYEEWGLLPNQSGNQITGLPAKRYPAFHDLLDLLNKKIQELEQGDYTDQQMTLISRKLIHLDNIRGQIKTLVNAYGYLFDGPTSIDNMNDVKTVTYNLSQLKDMDPQIFDLQIFNTLSICWDGAITNGTIMKRKWESGELELEEVTHTLILIDESHRWVNARKLFALENLSLFLREGPKYFIGIWLASQSIRDYIPEGSTADGIDTLKTIFELTQYKFIFHQDSNVIPIIDKVFNNSLTYAQRERIPRLQRGETILCIEGDKNIEFKVYLSKADERLFEGGA